MYPFTKYLKFLNKGCENCLGSVHEGYQFSSPRDSGQRPPQYPSRSDRNVNIFFATCSH